MQFAYHNLSSTLEYVLRVSDNNFYIGEKQECAKIDLYLDDRNIA